MPLNTVKYVHTGWAYHIGCPFTDGITGTNDLDVALEASRNDCTVVEVHTGMHITNGVAQEIKEYVPHVFTR